MKGKKKRKIIDLRHDKGKSSSCFTFFLKFQFLTCNMLVLRAYRRTEKYLPQLACRIKGECMFRCMLVLTLVLVTPSPSSVYLVLATLILHCIPHCSISSDGEVS
ncbi:unnamed protein product [Orchesella dallaii]|uniref:Uncharacterized protein n=1 Tax=Orchesella dallaii TaxID=48710 RepID=A0ABP1RFZ6_9HEXA